MSQVPVRITAVVTTPFYVNSKDARGAESLRNALVELVALRDVGVASILVLHDRRGKGGPVARSVCDELHARFAEQGVDLQPLEVQASETALRWPIGFRAAFALGADAVYNFPGDMKAPETETQRADNRAGWRRLIGRFQAERAARPEILVVGDYASVDTFKSQFDAMLTLDLIEAFWGRATRDQLTQLGHSKLRTEVFLISRDYFQAIDDDVLVALGPDPTVQLILHGLRKQFNVVSEHFGPFADDDQTRKRLGQFMQLLRMFGAQAGDRVWHEIAANRAEPQSTLLRRYRHLADTIEAGSAVVLQAIRGNADRLETEQPFGEERKVSLQSTWAKSPGVSYLFDPAGPRHFGLAAHGAAPLQCDLSHPALQLFQELHTAKVWSDLRKILCERFLFAPLPTPSWHVTAWDGVNIGNVETLTEHSQPAFKKFLSELPGSLAAIPYADALPADFGVDLAADGLRFGFERLEIRNSAALVAVLAPADEESARRLELVRKRRGHFDHACQVAFGKPANRELTPHLSLGYFPHGALADLAQPAVRNAQFALRAALEAKNAKFLSVSLYAFTDMAAFSKPICRNAAPNQT